MGPGQKNLTGGWVGSIFSCSGWVRSGQVSPLWFGFGEFPLKIPNFQKFLLWVKKNLFGSGQKVHESKRGWLLIYCR